jgi:hypothetical protein
MVFTTILTKKFTIGEILKNISVATLTPLVIYIMHLQNTQLSALNSLVVRTEFNSTEIGNKLKKLTDEVENLKKINTEQKAHIDVLQNQIQTQVRDTTTNIVTSDPNLIAVQNEMTQFYIKTAGIVIAVVLAAGIVYYVSTSTQSLLSMKGILPESTYKFIQRNTTFFQERAEYHYYDKETETSWIVNITNNEKVNLFVKPKDEYDFVSIFEWTKVLNEKWSTPQETTTQALEKILNTTPTDISTVPSGAEIDIIASNVVPTSTIDAHAAQVAINIADHIAKFF